MNRQEKLDVESGLRSLLEEMYALLNEKTPSLEYCSCSDLVTRITRAFRQIKNTNSEYKKLESVLQQQEAEILGITDETLLGWTSKQIRRSHTGNQETTIREPQIKEAQCCQSESKKKDRSHDCSQASPKKQLSFSQHGGYTSHRSSCDELFKRYNKLLQQQQASISQRSTNIQVSQYMMKGRQTLADICNIQPSRSQGKHNKSSISSEAIRSLLKMK